MASEDTGNGANNGLLVGIRRSSLGMNTYRPLAVIHNQEHAPIVFETDGIERMRIMGSV